MRKEVLININSKQVVGEKLDDLQLSVCGEMEEENGAVKLFYDESRTLNEKKVSTTLSLFESGTAVIERSGSLSSRLVLEPGRRNNSLYSTPYGDMMIGIFCNFVTNESTKSGRKIIMDYTVDSNCHEISKNSVTIKIKEV